MLYKWNHLVYNILGLVFHLHNHERFIQVVYRKSVFLLLSGGVWFNCIAACLTAPLLQEVCAGPILAVMNAAAMNAVYQYLCGFKNLFLWEVCSGASG